MTGHPPTHPSNASSAARVATLRMAECSTRAGAKLRTEVRAIDSMRARRELISGLPAWANATVFSASRISSDPTTKVRDILALLEYWRETLIKLIVGLFFLSRWYGILGFGVKSVGGVEDS